MSAPVAPVSTSGTIVAISSPPGGARRGILRLSGPEARVLVNRCVAAASGGGPVLLVPGAPRGVLPGRLDDGRGTQPALVLWMPGPASYTREDVAELHLPGSEPLLRRALARLVELGARPARAGEFTRRAFENGRIDLTRAEGVLELVRATNEGERRAALGLLEGGLARRVAGLRDALEDVAALVEASLDFDESDTGHVPEEELAGRLAAIEDELGRALAWEVARQPPAALPRVSLFGAPNAGKSSLFNALVGEHGALVSGLAGTTRDVLAGLWSGGGAKGAPVLLLDTPGVDPEACGPDAAGQRLGARERDRADAVLWVVDAAGGAGAGELAREARGLPAGVPVLGLWNQVDRPGAGPPPAPVAGEEAWLAVSARTGAGLAALGARLDAALGRAEAGASGTARELFARHRDALERAAGACRGARAELLAGHPLDQVAERMRGATHALDEIAGRTTAEDLLDRIFARFCLGK